MLNVILRVLIKNLSTNQKWDWNERRGISTECVHAGHVVVFRVVSTPEKVRLYYAKYQGMCIAAWF